MLASNGETGDPCGVPNTVAVTEPCSNTPTRSQPRINFSIDPLATLRSTRRIKAS